MTVGVSVGMKSEAMVESIKMWDLAKKCGSFFLSFVLCHVVVVVIIITESRLRAFAAAMQVPQGVGAAFRGEGAGA